MEASALHHLLTSCTHLTHLDLPSSVIDQAGLDVLLEYGTHITTLSVDSFELSESRADRPCSWQSLDLQLQSHRIAPSLLQFAHLPLRGVESISTGVQPDRREGWMGAADDEDDDDDDGDDDTQPLELIKVPLHPRQGMSHQQQAALLRQAATNLAACPAWGKVSTSAITIINDCPRSEPLPQSVVSDMLAAIAPLGGAHVKKLTICHTFSFSNLSLEAICVLGASLGKSVTEVCLRNCSLECGFWASFARSFPAVDTLDPRQAPFLLWCQAMGRPLTIIYSEAFPPACCCSFECSGNLECRCGSMGVVTDTLAQFGYPPVTYKVV
jgi:hypothetical protein